MTNEDILMLLKRTKKKMTEFQKIAERRKEYKLAKELDEEIVALHLVIKEREEK
jgi:hypothetical protein